MCLEDDHVSRRVTGGRDVRVSAMICSSHILFYFGSLSVSALRQFLARTHTAASLVCVPVRKNPRCVGLQMCAGENMALYKYIIYKVYKR